MGSDAERRGGGGRKAGRRFGGRRSIKNRERRRRAEIVAVGAGGVSAAGQEDRAVSIADWSPPGDRRLERSYASGRAAFNTEPEPGKDFLIVWTGAAVPASPGSPQSGWLLSRRPQVNAFEKRSVVGLESDPGREIKRGDLPPDNDLCWGMG